MVVLTKDKIVYFVVGLLSGLVITLLLGATTEFGPPSYGRYQISAWGTPLGKDMAGVGVFIVDTATGEIKSAYSRIYDGSNNAPAAKDELRKPFHSIK